jgi:hypothetical protein
LGEIAIRVPAHLAVLSKAFNSPAALIAGALTVVISCAVVVWFRQGRPPLAFAIIGSGTAFIVWWLAVSDWNWYKHVVPGYIFLALTCAYLVTVAVEQLQRSPWIDRALLTVAVLAAFACIPVASSTARAIDRILVPSPPLLTIQRDSEQHLAALVLQLKQREPTPRFWGYGHHLAPEISYLAAVPIQDITTGRSIGPQSDYLVIGPHYGATEVDTFADTACMVNLYRQGPFRLCLLRHSRPKVPVDPSAPRTRGPRRAPRMPLWPRL